MVGFVKMAEAMLCLRMCPPPPFFGAKFGMAYLNVLLFSLASFMKCERNATLFLWVLMELHLRVYLEPYSVSKVQLSLVKSAYCVTLRYFQSWFAIKHT
jgi:hypothetical protein